MSEIVGALMLTVIVVVAAGSFAVFVSERQKQVQDQQMYQLDKQQELLVINSLRPTTASGNDQFLNLNFTVTSEHQHESHVTKVAVDGLVLRQFETYSLNLSSGNWEMHLLHWNDTFAIDPTEQLFISVNATDFFQSSAPFNVTKMISMEITTSYQNSFSKVFMPPSAIVAITTEALWNGTSHNYTSYLVADGSGSAAQDGASVVYYNWTVTPRGGGAPIALYGLKTTVQFPVAGNYVITLTVTDSDGMVGRGSLSYAYA